MKTKTLGGTLLCVLMMLSAPVAVLAHEGHDHHLMGTVTAIDATHLTLTTKDGKAESVVITATTKVVREKTPAAIADIKVGARVMVETDGATDKPKAVTIMLGAEMKKELKKK